jgi:hypothetical protein
VRDAKSDALDADLAQLIDAWSALPEAARAGILAMVQAAVGSAPRNP